MSVVLHFATFLPFTTRSEVWKRINDWNGINDEFWPFLHMTLPRGIQHTVDDITKDTLPLISYISLFGIFPIDCHVFHSIHIEPENYLEEQSSNLQATFWKHKRQLIDHEGGIVVSDLIEFVPRVSFLQFIVKILFKAVFVWRHARLLLFFQQKHQTT